MTDFDGAGSPRYLSPELICPKPVRTLKSDVWAWGALPWRYASTFYSAFCMLRRQLQITTDMLPYRQIQDFHYLLARVKAAALPAVLEELQLNDGVRRIIQRCWQYKPRDRPTMRDVHEKLLRCLGSVFLEEGVYLVHSIMCASRR